MSSLRQHNQVKYSKDLSSEQIWIIFNELIYEAAAPLCVYNSMSIETALSCLALSTNNRRRISGDNPDKLLNLLFGELSQIVGNNTPASRLDLLEFLLNKGIERNILVDHIAYSLNYNLPEYIDRNKLKRHVAKYLSEYNSFKRDVVFRFYYLIESQANKNHYVKKLSGLNTTKQDMFHVYVISTMRAIDKFVAHKGTITSYIQSWFQNAEGSSDFMIFDDEAFGLNRSVRKSVQEGDKEINNKVIPLEDQLQTLASEETEHDTFNEFTQHIARLPNSTLVFLAQNIPYTLSASQIKRIVEHNRRA